MDIIHVARATIASAPLALLLGLLPGIGGAHAAERITRFHADIEVLADGSMTVVETIAVRAEGREIKRGIYRDFPTVYRGVLGRRTVGFEVLGVERDARPEPWFTQALSNGVRVYIGDADRMLDPGDYVYTIAYRTDRQLGFFDAHDELYWNVTGNGWAFPIERASADVRLPDSVPPAEIGVEAYTGPAGAREARYTAAVDAGGTARVESTAALAPGEGLTLVVTWPPGHLARPDLDARVSAYFTDNRALAIGAGGLLLLLVYYALAWLRVGRDPQAGIVIPRYEPPPGYSPAAMRFVSRMGYDHKTFASALVNLAVKGRLSIREADGDFVLAREDDGNVPTKGAAESAPGEAVLMRRLFAGARRVALERANHRTIKAAMDAHERSLGADYETRYFRINLGFTAVGIGVSLATLGVVLWRSPIPQGELAGAGFMVVWLTGWTFGVFMLSKLVVNTWRVGRGFSGTVTKLGLTLFALPFFAGEAMGLWFLARAAGPEVVVLALALVAVNWIFYELMKAPTLAGRRLLDVVAGFREYLRVAEGDELAMAGGPRRTPELFERYLPFAMALDVEQAWGEKFSDVIEAAELNGDYQQPEWYHGEGWDDGSPGSFAAALGSSLSASVASSSTAPGSSSGAGGGGSSGGGGGGGGGGGW